MIVHVYSIILIFTDWLFCYNTSFVLTLLHLERTKLCTILAFLSAKGYLSAKGLMSECLGTNAIVVKGAYYNKNVSVPSFICCSDERHLIDYLDSVLNHPYRTTMMALQINHMATPLLLGLNVTLGE